MHKQTIEIKEPITYKIELKSYGNPDFGQNPYEERSPHLFKEFSTIEQARKIKDEYCGAYHLGGGNFAGGNITKDGKIVAVMSFNGRVWESSTGDLSETGNEIKELK